VNGLNPPSPDQPLADFYDHAGLMTTAVGTMFSTHVGDDLQWYGFAEGMNAPGDDAAKQAAHPIYGPGVQLIGVVALVALFMYMDHRIKVPLT